MKSFFAPGTLVWHLVMFVYNTAQNIRSFTCPPSSQPTYRRALPLSFYLRYSSALSSPPTIPPSSEMWVCYTPTPQTPSSYCVHGQGERRPGTSICSSTWNIPTHPFLSTALLSAVSSTRLYSSCSSRRASRSPLLSQRLCVSSPHAPARSGPRHTVVLSCGGAI